MSATNLLAIDSPTMQLAAKFITQLLAHSLLACQACSKSLEPASCAFVSARDNHSLDQSYFFCSLCSLKAKKELPSARVLPFKMVYDMLCAFNSFDMQAITRGVLQNIIKRIQVNSKIPAAEREQNKRLVEHYLVGCSQVQASEFQSLASKVGFVVASISCLVNRIEGNPILGYWFYARSLSKGFSEDKAALLTGMMKTQISIKLQTLKLLHQYLKQYSQPLSFRHICRQACIMMKSPLQTFLKTQETAKNVIFSINRREIQLKNQEQCQIKSQQDYQSMEQVVRLIQPMRTQGIIFKLKCLTSLQTAVRVGFYFMSQESYAAEAQYEKAMQPVTVNLLVVSGSNDDQKTENFTEFSTEMARHEPEKGKLCTILKSQRKKQVKLQISEEEMSGVSGKKSCDSEARKGKEVTRKGKEVASETRIELRYQRSSSSFSIQSLSSKQSLFKKKYYKSKKGVEMKKLEVFACAILVGPNCSVEYVVDQPK